MPEGVESLRYVCTTISTHSGNNNVKNSLIIHITIFAAITLWLMHKIFFLAERHHIDNNISIANKIIL